MIEISVYVNTPIITFQEYPIIEYFIRANYDRPINKLPKRTGYELMLLNIPFATGKVCSKTYQYIAISITNIKVLFL